MQSSLQNSIAFLNESRQMPASRTWEYFPPYEKFNLHGLDGLNWITIGRIKIVTFWSCHFFHVHLLFLAHVYKINIDACGNNIGPLSVVIITSANTTGVETRSFSASIARWPACRRKFKRPHPKELAVIKRTDFLCQIPETCPSSPPPLNIHVLVYH